MMFVEYWFLLPRKWANVQLRPCRKIQRMEWESWYILIDGTWSMFPTAATHKSMVMGLLYPWCLQRYSAFCMSLWVDMTVSINLLILYSTIIRFCSSTTITWMLIRILTTVSSFRWDVWYSECVLFWSTEFFYLSETYLKQKTTRSIMTITIIAFLCRLWFLLCSIQYPIPFLLYNGDLIEWRQVTHRFRNNDDFGSKSVTIGLWWWLHR